METIKKIAKYTTNVLAIIGALVSGINAIDGITIPYAYQIVQVIVVITGVIGTYLLGDKAINTKTINEQINMETLEELENGVDEDEIKSNN